MELAAALFEDSREYLLYSNAVILNYGSHMGQKLYFIEQAPDAIPFPEPLAGVPNEYAGLTTWQLRNGFGVTIGGELAPVSAVTDPSLVGLLSP
jgi:hypothetical protein